MIFPSELLGAANTADLTRSFSMPDLSITPPRHVLHLMSSQEAMEEAAMEAS